MKIDKGKIDLKKVLPYWNSCRYETWAYGAKTKKC